MGRRRSSVTPNRSDPNGIVLHESRQVVFINPKVLFTNARANPGTAVGSDSSHNEVVGH